MFEPSGCNADEDPVAEFPDDILKHADAYFTGRRRYLENSTTLALQLLNACAGQNYPTGDCALAHRLLEGMMATAANILNVTAELPQKYHLFVRAGSVLTLCRVMLERYVQFYFLEIEPVSVDEREFRMRTMKVHEHTRRLNVLKHARQKGIEDERLRTEALRDQACSALIANAVFQQLPADRQKSLLAGWKTPYDLEAVAMRGGIEQWVFNLHHAVFSEFTHGGPLAIANEIQEYNNSDSSRSLMHMGQAIEFCAFLLRYGCNGYALHWPEAVEEFQRAPKVVPLPWRT